MKERMRLAFSASVVKRAIKYAVVVGFILIAINHGAAIVSGRVTGTDLIQMLLTLMVPYIVSTLSSVGAMLEAR